MNELWITLSSHAHSALGHFPLALLLVSVACDFAARRWPQLRTTAWVLLVLGTIGAVIATISGLIAHIPYEESQYIEQIEWHQYMAFATTAIFAGLTAWRWRQRHDAQNVAGSSLWAVLTVLGAAILIYTGYLGGALVLNYGIGVITR